MAATEQVFNLDRKVNIAENIDPTGKKWEIKRKTKAGSLYVAVVNPYNAQTLVPDAFSGAWTSPHVLQEKIEVWLNTQWDKSEKAAQRSAITAHQAKVEAKITPEESLEALAPEIKAMIEEDNAEVTKEEEANEEAAASEDKAEADNDQEEAQVEASEEVDAEATAVPSTPKKEKVAKKKAVTKKGK